MTDVRMGDSTPELQLEIASRAVGTSHPLAVRHVTPSILLVCVGLAASLVMTLGILVTTGGRLEYTLDDPYIHLRLSQMIASGTYGINAGQPASPSSSIIWPFLLVPFVGTWLHPYVPLVISVTSLVGSLLLAFRGLAATWLNFDPTGRRRIAVTVAAGLFLNWFGLPFTGLEHSLHVLTAVGCAAGLLVLVYRHSTPWWLWASIVASPLVRYEGIAVSAVTLVAVAVLGRWRPAIAVAGFLTVSLGLFTGCLMGQGLPPLPDSVIAKWGAGAGNFSATAILGRAAMSCIGNLASHSSVILLFAVCLASTTILSACAARDGVRNPAIVPLFSASGVLLLHLGFGNNGGLSRYEIYALSYATILLIGVLAPVFRLGFVRIGALATLLVPATFAVFASPLYVMDTLNTPRAAQEIFDQQHQMHVFAVDYLRAPVAVNDLGEVSYNNPREVVDLWGLGSNEALKARFSGDPHWISGLVDPGRVPAAMVYTDWFATEIPTTWVRVGSISVSSRGAAAEAEVDVYATSRETVPQVVSALTLFQGRTGGRTTVTVTPGS